MPGSSALEAELDGPWTADVISGDESGTSGIAELDGTLVAGGQIPGGSRDSDVPGKC